jgi:hypothetical protein
VTLVAAVDGGYTNGVFLRHLPERTVAIGRIRKDARLWGLPAPRAPGSRGRQRLYGEPLATPEEIRRDAAIPWKRVSAWAAGKVHRFRVKTLEAPVRWRGAGGKDLRLVVIAPLSYRLSKGSRLLYRQPAYLICTDPRMALRDIVQFYLWRWEVEVNFRDEKTLLGMGQAQVREKSAAQALPAFIGASYAALLLSAHGAWGDAGSSCPVARPKWQRPRPAERMSTQQMIAALRSQLWFADLERDFSPLAAHTPCDTKPEKFPGTLKSAVIYAQM